MRIGYELAAVGFLFAAGSLSAEEGKPASAVPGRSSERSPVNAYNGMQQREETFEFSDKPKVSSVKGQGEENPSTGSGQGKWVITFTSKAACDATVAVLDKDGRVIRHLASGVLGKNAPYPFQQNSLTQKIEWDGADDRGNAVSRDLLKDCKVRVGLGLRAEFEKNIAYDAYEFPGAVSNKKDGKSEGGFLVGKGSNDEVYILSLPGSGKQDIHGRVFAKDGKYVRTFWPPSAKDIAKLGPFKVPLLKTDWGDTVAEVPRKFDVTAWAFNGRDVPKTAADWGAVPFALAGISEFKEGPRPACIPAPTLSAEWTDMFNRGRVRMAADRVREELYIGKQQGGMMRFDGKTGRKDETWFPKGDLNVTEVCVGPEGHVYIGVGATGYNQFIVRLDHGGKVVPFGGDAVPIAKDKWQGGGGQYGEMEGGDAAWDTCPAALRGVEVKALWTGLFGKSNTHERGLYVSPRGCIVAPIQLPWAERALKYGAPKERSHEYKGRPYQNYVAESYVAVWDNDGRFLTANAVGDTLNGHGVAMDSDGNIYAATLYFPKDTNCLVGLSSRSVTGGSAPWGGVGSIVKFRGGVPFPRASWTYNDHGSWVDIVGKDGAIQWTYPGLVCQAGDCTCHHIRYDMDYFARHWIPANYLGSVIVIDANANIVARIGRYGNVDDADPKCGKIHLAWPRALCVSDTALYVADPVARRVLKAALKYVAEETIALP